MPKRARRITPTQDVFKRLCIQVQGDQTFRDAIDRVRRRFGITPEPFPRDGNEMDFWKRPTGDMAWWKRTTPDLEKAMREIRDRWFGSLPDEYRLLWGAATLFVRRQLLYKEPPIPSQPPPPFVLTLDQLFGEPLLAMSPPALLPTVLTLRHVFGEPLLALRKEIEKELQRVGWRKKVRAAFWPRIASRWLQTLAANRREEVRLQLVEAEEQWQRELKIFDVPIIVIPPYVTSTQYRSWWPEVERARDRAYGRPKFPRRLRAGDYGEEIDKMIATMWAAGKSESAITAAVSEHPSVAEDSDRYDHAAEYVRAVVRGLPKRHRKAKARERLPGAASTGSRSLPRG